MWIVSIILQIGEGYLQFSMGEINCGTQLKLTAILSGTLFALLAYSYINNQFTYKIKILKILGDTSFGIYFSHLAVMAVLHHFPYYSRYIGFPFTALITICITLLCVELGKKVMGKYAKYIAV